MQSIFPSGLLERAKTYVSETAAGGPRGGALHLFRFSEVFIFHVSNAL
jgi:hypothetical protein